MRDRGPFGPSRRPGRVDEHGDGVARGRTGRAVTGLPSDQAPKLFNQQDVLPGRQVAPQAAIRQHRPRLGVTENVSDLTLAVKDVNRGENQPQLNGRQVRGNQLDAIGEVDAQPVADLESARLQMIREPIAAPLQLAERPFAAAKLERGIGGSILQGQIKQIDEIHETGSRAAYPDGSPTVPQSARRQRRGRRDGNQRVRPAPALLTPAVS